MRFFEEEKLMSKEIKIGLIGAGWMGKAHTTAFHNAWIEVFENYVGGYLWLSDLDRGNDYIPIDRARPFQLDTDVRHYLYLRRGLSG